MIYKGVDGGGVFEVLVFLELGEGAADDVDVAPPVDLLLGQNDLQGGGVGVGEECYRCMCSLVWEVGAAEDVDAAAAVDLLLWQGDLQGGWCGILVFKGVFLSGAWKEQQQTKQASMQR